MTLAPVLLRPDNFTPPSRTPWGGRRIRSRYKPSLPPATAVVGESWEVSVEPSFPSLTRDGRLLSELVATDAAGWLGRATLRRFGPQTPLLVKLLDAADNLSVQVHPADDDADLAAGEGGKPEAWLVVESDPGAGVYLGFRDGVDVRLVRSCIEAGGRLDELMSFVPVAPGDAFIVESGTPHAIGAGVTLLEPQLVRPGRVGVTYRFWDWNRRYDEGGALDAAGRPRPLHLARSLAITRWQDSGARLIEQSRMRPERLDPAGLRSSVIRWPWFYAERWAGTGELSLPATDALWAVTCLGGRVAIDCRAGALDLGCGDSGVVPAAAGDLRVTLAAATAFAVRAAAE